MQLFKAHGLGNDYLVLEEGRPLDATLVRALCDRHRGVGGDGILEPRDSDRAEHGVRIWNPDGSVAEKSGNGLRIHAWWLHAERGAPPRFRIDTGAEVVACEVDGDEVRLEMGRARFEADEVPVGRALIDDVVEVDGQPLSVVAVGLGNPHCVVFRTEPLDTLPWARWGERLERHPLFPNRTNVQVARVQDGALELRIWERGAGPTLASGSSSCAAVAAAVRTGRLPPGRHTARMPGGELHVTVGADWQVRLEGPVGPVARIRLDPRWSVTS